jgi:dipeptidyl aminopeptidase/acylaminoacyl peptidase
MKPLRAKYLLCIFTAAFAASMVPSLTAQTPGPQKSQVAALLTELGRTRAPLQASISPDGQTVAWVAPGGKEGTRIFLRAFDGAAETAQQLSIPGAAATACDESDIAWAADSKHIAFTSDCASPGQQQVFVAEVSQTGHAETPHPLTHVKGFVHDLSWSPDNTHLGFLFVANATRPPDALHAIKPRIGVISTATMAEIQRVAVIAVPNAVDPAELPAITEVTPKTLHVYEFSWSPDSTQLAYVAAPPPGDDNWWVAQLYTQAVVNGTPHSILQPKLQIAVPRWSPNGKQIAFIQGLMSDAGQIGGDIYLIPAQGGAARNLTPGRKASPAWLHWFGPDRLGFTEIVDGQIRFSVLNSASGKEDTAARVTFPGDSEDGVQQLSLSFSRTASPRAATIQSSFSQPPEVWAGPLGHLEQITHLNTDLKPDWGNAESITWNNEGFRVQGWLMFPKNYDSARKYPMILWVHGGPANKTLPRWPGVGYGPVAFSTAGYFVLMPNPRGSFGEGETFTQANRKDFGYGDLRDLLAGVDVVSRKFPIDPNRVGITGWSYGGFMTMFAVTQTHRFRAAVAGAGISDWKSYYGENSIDQWMIPYFGASVYDDPGVYAKSSAINFIHNAKTPMLIVVGDRDGECPAPQSFEMWHGLRAMHVPVRLVVYANEGHGFVLPGDRQDVLERALNWFAKYMPSSQVPTSSAAQH